MTKIWVPIDLPDGHLIEYVVAKPMSGSERMKGLPPLGPAHVEPPLSEGPERWEYDWYRGSNPDGNLKDKGAVGWEAYAVTLDANSFSIGPTFWLKRRL